MKEWSKKPSSTVLTAGSTSAKTSGQAIKNSGTLPTSLASGGASDAHWRLLCLVN